MDKPPMPDTDCRTIGRKDSSGAVLAHAISLHGRGALAEAAAECQKVLRRDSSHSGAWHLAGVISHQTGRHAEAAQFITRAIETEPANPEYWNNLAAICLAMGSPDMAIRCCEQALQHRPDFAEAYNHLGTALRGAGKVDAAETAYRRALELRPNSSAVHSNLAATYQELGRFDVAMRHYQEALRLDPHDCCTYFNLSEWVQRGKYQFTAEQLTQIDGMLQSPDLPLEPAIQLCFSAARTHESRGNFGTAFTLFAKGNALRSKLLALKRASFDAQRHESYISRIMKSFDTPHFEEYAGVGAPSELLVFIVGMPRSGTTLVEQILSSHPAIFGAGELECIPNLARTIGVQLGSEATYPECMRDADRLKLRHIAETHVADLRKLAPAAARVTDKLPGNFIHLGLIAMLFPDATVIHCRRDPLDVCLSCYSQNFKADDTAAYCCSLESLAVYYREYERLARHWAAVLPLRVLEIKYELLIRSPYTEIRRLLEFCRVPWDDRCLDFHKTPRAVRTASSLQVREPIYDTSIGRWQRYAPELEPLRRAIA